MNMKRTQIALAVCTLMSAPLLMVPGVASADDHHHHHRSSGADPAVVTDIQAGVRNTTTTYNHDNHVHIGGTAGNNARGNVGVNAASGENNMQDNAAAIADTRFVFGGAMSSTTTNQASGSNIVRSLRSDNSAGMNGGFAGASGNIGINEAAGSGNMQKNNLALSRTASDTELSDASVTSTQVSGGNNVIRTNSDNTTYLTGNSLNGISGNVGVNIASGSGNLQSNSLAVATSPAAP